MNTTARKSKAELLASLDDSFKRADNAWNLLKEIIKRLITTAEDQENPRIMLTSEEARLLKSAGVEGVLNRVIAEIGLECEQICFDETDNSLSLKM